MSGFDVRVTQWGGKRDGTAACPDTPSVSATRIDESLGGGADRRVCAYATSGAPHERPGHARAADACGRRGDVYVSSSGCEADDTGRGANAGGTGSGG